MEWDEVADAEEEVPVAVAEEEEVGGTRVVFLVVGTCIVASVGRI